MCVRVDGGGGELDEPNAALRTLESDTTLFV